MDNCVFCKIISKELPGDILYEDAELIVFLSLENHPLVVPKKHLTNIYEVEKEDGVTLMNGLIAGAKAVKTALTCDGVHISQANEPAAGQEVNHIHFHIYPRWEGRGKEKPTAIMGITRSELAEKVRQKFTMV